MSKGAGHVERALRRVVSEHEVARGKRAFSTQVFTSESLMVAAFGMGHWTEAQRRSVLRAMHRIIAGQPGWATVKVGRRVRFHFTPPAETPKSRLAATNHLLPRAKPPRQQRREKREKLAARERNRTLPYFWTAGRDTVDNGLVASLLDLPRGCKVTTLPETIPRYQSGIGCEAFDRVVQPPQTEEEALRALGFLDRIITAAVSYEEVRWYQLKAGAIRYMFANIKAVRNETDFVELHGEWWIARHLAAVSRFREEELYVAPTVD